MKKLLFGIAILAIAVMSQAQRGGFMMGGAGGGANPAMLLGREDVQKDLALTDAQKDKVATLTDQNAMRDRFMKAMQDAGVSFEDMRTDEGRKKMQPIMEKMQADMKKEIDAILTPEQSKRLGQIGVQMAGNRAILQKDVAKALGITDDQNEKIQNLVKMQGDAQRGLFQKMQDGELTREDLQDKMKKNGEIFDTELGKLLTDNQKAKLKEMGGKPFEKKDDGGL
ncbi:MAG: hypothetical protein JST12_12380 [Armatimonadetes bacterium]|nr:hypothetical protein [Armatimonadota bacterium]MBS1702453.1 hypothetical protein [Armatimonadota bacterium]MBS1725881.1 hypothetical protein [Armatimonadota bacterium]